MKPVLKARHHWCFIQFKMNKKNILLLVSFLLFLAIIVQAWLVLPSLNNNVITHFGAGGKADGWSTKESFFWTQILLSLFIFLLMAGISLIIRKLPDSAVNIPNKAFWLSPERRESTLDTISFYINMINAALLLFFFVLFRDLIEINFNGKNSLDANFWIAFLTFMIFTLGITIRILTLFSSKGIEKGKHG
ncbi:MAG: DUF1648 domain-containing protein [Ignavibacteria bacterium]|nr:DUF1648 domain-containing protein [Ignavibacteria bacterium]